MPITPEVDSSSSSRLWESRRTRPPTSPAALGDLGDDTIAQASGHFVLILDRTPPNQRALTNHLDQGRIDPLATREFPSLVASSKRSRMTGDRNAP